MKLRIKESSIAFKAWLKNNKHFQDTDFNRFEISDSDLEMYNGLDYFMTQLEYFDFVDRRSDAVSADLEMSQLSIALKTNYSSSEVDKFIDDIITLANQYDIKCYNFDLREYYGDETLFFNYKFNVKESVKRRKRGIRESGEPFITFDDFGKSDTKNESDEEQLRKALDMFIIRDDANDQRYGSWKVKFEDGNGKPELAMSISYYGDIVCRMYYDRDKGYSLKCEHVPELDFDIESVVRDVLDEHGIIVRG